MGDGYPRGALTLLGPYAEGNDGTEEVVFAAFMGENHAGLTPLERFGFILHPGRCQRATACTAISASSGFRRLRSGEVGGSSAFSESGDPSPCQHLGVAAEVKSNQLLYADPRYQRAWVTAPTRLTRA